MQKLQVMQTADGSHTLWVPDMEESFHSIHGAITESEHVFVKNGLDFFLNSTNLEDISILEIGFGTGLNALLTCRYCQEQKQKVKYTCLEPFPLSWDLVEKLNYPTQISHPQASFWFKELHKTSWGQIEWLNPYFSILKIQETIQHHARLKQYDICYFDAFAPEKQPEMWDLKILDTIRRSLKSPGQMVSYCAQGQFKRNLKELGFKIESLPGPPGKYEMTRATLVI